MYHFFYNEISMTVQIRKSKVHNDNEHLIGHTDTLPDAHLAKALTQAFMENVRLKPQVRSILLPSE